MEEQISKMQIEMDVLLEFDLLLIHGLLVNYKMGQLEISDVLDGIPYDNIKNLKLDLTLCYG